MDEAQHAFGQCLSGTITFSTLGELCDVSNLPSPYVQTIHWSSMTSGQISRGASRWPTMGVPLPKLLPVRGRWVVLRFAQ